MIVPTSVHISLTLYALKKMCEAIKEGEVRATFLNSLGHEVSGSWIMFLFRLGKWVNRGGSSGPLPL